MKFKQHFFTKFVKLDIDKININRKRSVRSKHTGKKKDSKKHKQTLEQTDTHMQIQR